VGRELPSARRCRPDDVWRLRAFLRNAVVADADRPRTWSAARLDYTCAHVLPAVAGLALHDVAWVWEAGTAIVALALPDGPLGEAHLSLAPAYRDGPLLAEVLERAEASLAARDADGRSRLVVWTHVDDERRVELLRERGYAPSGVVERVYRRLLTPDVDPPTPPAGYRIRPLGDGLDLLERCYASGLAFHDGDHAVAVENRDDPSWYRRIQRAPLYRRDLDLVAVADDGAVAGFVTAWFDDVTRDALLEPVGVVPAHRQRGLARALVASALACVAHRGALRAFVGGYDDAAHALYGALLGDGSDDIAAWRRSW
jgi:mycothiol synthase